MAHPAAGGQSHGRPVRITPASGIKGPLRKLLPATANEEQGAAADGDGRLLVMKLTDDLTPIRACFDPMSRY